MTDFQTFPTLRAAETAALAILTAAPALPEGALAYIVTAHADEGDAIVFAPLFRVRHLDWIDRRSAEAARDFVLREKHRVVFGGETFGPGDEGECAEDEEELDCYDDEDRDYDDGLSSRDRELGDRLDMGRNDAGEWLGFC